MGLRVGLLHYTAPPVVGGVESVIGHHARLLADRGHAVRLIAGRGGRVDPRVEDVRIALADTRAPAIRRIRAALATGRVPASFDATALSLAASLRRATSGLDVLVVHNVLGLPFNLPLTRAIHELVVHGPGPPVIAWHHDVAQPTGRFAHELHPGPPWSLLRDPPPGVTHVAISAARRVEVAELTGLDPERIRVIPNGIDVEGFLALHPATRARIGPLGLPADGPLILCPARITPRKHLELAIRATAELRRDGDDAHLIVTGPPDPHDGDRGAYGASLLALAASLGVRGAVHLLAPRPRQRTPPRVVSDLYRLADVLLLTSRDEGFGLPILEAAVCRLPIVCADLPSLRELAGPDAAYFAPDATPGTVADRIRQRLAAEPVSRLAARIRSAFGWSAIVETAIEPLLVEVAGMPPAVTVREPARV